MFGAFISNVAEKDEKKNIFIFVGLAVIKIVFRTQKRQPDDKQ